MGPSPLHEKHSVNRPNLPHPGEIRAHVETGQGSPSCTSAKKHGHHPLPTPYFKNIQEHILRVSIISWGGGGPRIERGNSNIRSHVP